MLARWLSCIQICFPGRPQRPEPLLRHPHAVVVVAAALGLGVHNIGAFLAIAVLP